MNGSLYLLFAATQEDVRAHAQKRQDCIVFENLFWETQEAPAEKTYWAQHYGIKEPEET